MKANADKIYFLSGVEVSGVTKIELAKDAEVRDDKGNVIGKITDIIRTETGVTMLASIPRTSAEAKKLLSGNTTSCGLHFKQYGKSPLTKILKWLKLSDKVEETTK